MENAPLAISPPTGVETWIDQVRVDHNLFLNLSDIELTFQKDSVLARDFIIYLAHTYKADIFGYTEFCIADFCKVMQWNKKNIQKTHDLFQVDPEEGRSAQLPPKVGQVEMKSFFDYVLYRLFSQKIILSKTEKTKVPTLNIVRATSIEVIRDLNILYDPKKPDRRIYQIKLERGFLENILNFYVTISLKDYLKVGSGWDNGRHKSLYLYLCGSRHGLIHRNETVLTPNFNLLCEIAGIATTIKEPRNRMVKLKKYLNEVSGNSDLKFEVKFFATKQQKYPYSVEIIFSKDKLTLESTRKNYLFNHMNGELRKGFAAKYPRYKEDDTMFQKWLTNRAADTDVKQQIIRKAYTVERNQTVDKAEDKELEDLLKYYIDNLNKPKA